MVEPLAIREAPSLLKTSGFDNIIVEFDSWEVIHASDSSKSPCSEVGLLLDDCGWVVFLFFSS